MARHLVNGLKRPKLASEEALNKRITSIVAHSTFVGFRLRMEFEGCGEPIIAEPQDAYDEVRSRLLSQASVIQ